MKVLLINPSNDYKSTQDAPETERWLDFPIGLLYTATGLPKEHAVTILDLKLHNLDQQQLSDLLQEMSPDVVGVSAWIDNFPSLKEIADMAHSVVPESKLIIGGPFATQAPEVYLKECGADAVVTGEGRKAFADILGSMDERDSWPEIPGVYVMGADGEMRGTPRLTHTAPPPVSECLEALETYYPREQMEPYIDGGERFPGKRGAMIMGSMGCPHNCEFCSPRYLGNYSGRDLDDLEAEVKFLKEKYDADTLFFTDATFNLSKDRVLQVCDIMKRHGMEWYVEARVDNIDAEIAETMADSGCREIMIGIESFDQEVLNETGKRTTLDQVKQSISQIQEAGIPLTGFVLFGLPGQTEEQIQNNLEQIRELDIRVIPNLLFPIPGTPVWEKAKEAGMEPDVLKLISEDLPRYNREGRTSPVINLTQVSDERLTEAVQQVYALNAEYDERHRELRPEEPTDPGMRV